MWIARRAELVSADDGAHGSVRDQNRGRQQVGIAWGGAMLACSRKRERIRAGRHPGLVDPIADAPGIDSGVWVAATLASHYEPSSVVVDTVHAAERNAGACALSQHNTTAERAVLIRHPCDRCDGMVIERPPRPAMGRCGSRRGLD